MVRMIAAACAVLLLAACAPVAAIGTGSTPSSTSSPATVSLRTADEKALLAVEATYGAVLRAVEVAVDARALKGDKAEWASRLLATANSSVKAARAAYAAGQSVQMAARLTDATAAISSVRALIGK